MCDVNYDFASVNLLMCGDKHRRRALLLFIQLSMRGRKVPSNSFENVNRYSRKKQIGNDFKIDKTMGIKHSVGCVLAVE